VADNLFNPDPYYQQGGDMVRVGGMGYTMNVDAEMGQRVTGMHLLSSGAPIEATRKYIVAGWGSINELTKGPPVWDLVARHLTKQKLLAPQTRPAVKFVRAAH
jgi:sulfur-oxidizing protein SoxB